MVKYDYIAYGEIVEVYDNTNYELSKINPFRYEGYYYDEESKMYYCKTRYYVPEWCRWLNTDSPLFLDFNNIQSTNLFSYCGNDPVNNVYPNGNDWVKVCLAIVSSLFIIGGIALSATGVGGFFGGALLGMGAGSLINGYTNENNDGSYLAGWIGGVVSGFICGTGAGIGGSLLVSAVNTANLGAIGYLVASTLTSFTGGFLGNFVGSLTTTSFDNKKIDYKQVALDSLVIGGLNVLAGIASGIANITSSLSRTLIDTSSKLSLRIISGVIAGGTEFTYDIISWIYGKLMSLF